MGPRRERRHRDDRHHRSRAGRARRSGVRRSAGSRPCADKGGAARGRRVGEGRLRRLQPGVGRGHREQQRGAERHARADEQRSVRRGLAVQGEAEQQRRAREPARRRKPTRRSSRRRGTDMPFIPHTEADVREMLAAIGAPSIDALFDEIPAALRIKSLAGIPEALTEMEVGRLMQRARGARRPSAQLPRRRRLRASHSGRGLGDRDARRVLQRLHAIPGGSEPGHAAAALRIPDDDGEPDGHAGLECVAVRRRFGAGRSVPDGGARASQVEVGAHPRAGGAQSDLRRGGACDHRGTRTSSSTSCRTTRRAARLGAAALDAYRGPGHHRGRHPAAELLRRARRRRCASPIGRAAQQRAASSPS